MKKFPVFLMTLSLVVLFSCNKDNPWISMTALENEVWNDINAFRADSGQAAVTVNYDTMVEQAKKYSSFRAAGNEDPDLSELKARWDIIFDRWGGTNPVTVMIQTTKGSSNLTAEDIFNPDNLGSDIRTALLEDVSIGGVGVGFDKDGNAFTTIMMMKVE